MKTEDYQILLKECKKQGCFCPREHIVSGEIANIPLYLRIWFKLEGQKVK